MIITIWIFKKDNVKLFDQRKNFDRGLTSGHEIIWNAKPLQIAVKSEDNCVSKETEMRKT